jgi:glutamate synthase (ferredoxin)
MTGGEVVILGRAGRNFGAGMSGGLAWVLDETGDFAARSNLDLVGMGPVVDPDEADHLKDLITRHAIATQSKRAQAILKDWDIWRHLFVRVMPHDYERVLESQARMREKGLPEEEAVLAAFEENARSLSRADGN